MIKKMNNILKKHTLIMFYAFLLLQPVFDLIIGVFSHYNINTLFISLIRIFFLIYCLYYLIFIRKINFKKFIPIILYCVIYVFINVRLSDAFIEIENLIKIIYFPIMILFVFDLFDKENFKTKYLYIILVAYLLLILVPDILGISYESYLYDKIGTIGLFYSANAVGSTISMIAPIFICYLLKNKKILSLILFLVLYFYVLLMMGTKAPLITMLIIIIYYAILIIIRLIKKRDYVHITLFFLTCLFATFLLIKILPVTSFYKNLIIHAKNMKVSGLKDLLNIEKLDKYIFSQRLTFFLDSLKLYVSSSFIHKLFGIGYVISNKVLKTSEMDYLVMLIHNGVVGFVIIYYDYIKKLFIMFKKYLSKLRQNFFDIEKSSIVIAVIISLLNALLVGHVLDVPSVSIIVSIIILLAFKKLDNKKIL